MKLITSMSYSKLRRNWGAVGSDIAFALHPPKEQEAKPDVLWQLEIWQHSSLMSKLIIPTSLCSLSLFSKDTPDWWSIKGNEETTALKSFYCQAKLVNITYNYASTESLAFSSTATASMNSSVLRYWSRLTLHHTEEEYYTHKHHIKQSINIDNIQKALF
jgi:hypothetical protein